LNQAAKNELESIMQNTVSLLVKRTSTQSQVIHSRHAETADAAARVVARYAKLPSYSSINPDLRASNPDWRTKIHSPIKRVSDNDKSASRSTPLANVKPLAWLTEPEETKTVPNLKRHVSRNQSVSFNSAEEAGVQMNTALIEASGSLLEHANSTPDSLPSPMLLPEADHAAQLHKVRANTKAHASEFQLNIFEVDPGFLSLDLNLDPTIIDSANLVPANSEPNLPSASAPELPLPLHLDFYPSGLSSLPTPAQEAAAINGIEEEIKIQSPDFQIQVPTVSAPPLSATPQSAAPQSAPWSRRAMAGLVDLALSLVCFAALTLAATRFAPDTLALHPSIKLGVIAFLVVAFLYQTFFSFLLGVTPGARFADLSMCSFGAAKPTEGQIGMRLLLLPISVLPAGLGLLWALFDSEHLCLHDRLSHTCLRYQY
jgi:uncharacterized RDD family membrane protein YckC